MTPAEKIKYFEFVLTKLLDWYSEKCGPRENNDLSILKSLKLLFFISAARSDEAESTLVDNVFNDFWALPLGHVELTIYNYIKENRGQLNFYSINDTKTTQIQNPVFNDLNSLFLDQIETSVSYLREQNAKLICLPAFALVDLSHSWYSWQSSFQIAKAKGSKREQIEPHTIKSEDKRFSLLAF